LNAFEKSKYNNKASAKCHHQQLRPIFQEMQQL